MLHKESTNRHPVVANVEDRQVKRKLLALVLGAVVITVGGVAQAQESTDAQWIHVRVNEDSGAKVSVNLPISLLEVALDIAQQHGFEGHDGMNLRLGRHGDMELADLRKMWTELREAGDAEYVNVEDGDETVKIFRQGDRVMIQVNDDDEQQVRVEVPFSVVDTLLGGEGDELNLTGALRELARTNDGEIVQVQGGDTNVRVWIDTNSQD